MRERPNVRIFKDIPVSLWTNWRPEGVRSAIDAHDLGNFTLSAQLSESMLRDDKIAATLNTRILGLLGLPRRVEPSAHSDRLRAELAARVVEDNYDRLLPLDVAAQLVRWGVLQGYALVEVIWEGDEYYWSFKLKPWHPSFLYYDISRRTYVLMTAEGPVDIDPGNSKWCLYTPSGQYRGWIAGAVRSIAEPWLGRKYAFRDWLRFNEVHGLPIKKIKAPAGSPEAEKDGFFEDVEEMGSEGTVICPQGVDGEGWDIDLLEAKSTSWETFGTLIKDCDTRIAIALLGQNLTTEVQGGSFAAARVHGQVRQDYLEADAKTLSEVIYTQLLRPWATYNYGDPDLAPRVIWDTTPPEDLGNKAEQIAKISSAIGTIRELEPRVDVRLLLEQYGIPLRKETPARGGEHEEGERKDNEALGE